MVWGRAASVPRSAIPSLINAMTDSVVTVRTLSADVLRKVAPSDPSVVAAMSRALRGGPIDLRFYAVNALAASHDSAVLPVLREAVEDSVGPSGADAATLATLRWQAMRAMASFGPASDAAMKPLLSNPNAELRALAHLLTPAASRQPIIDTHAHGGAQYDPEFDGEWLRRDMELDNVVLAYTSLHGDTLNYARWRREEPTRRVFGPLFPCRDGQIRGTPCFPETNGWPDLGWLRREYTAGRLGVMGEMTYVYYGIAPTDERLEPYFALAEELDIPIAVHMRVDTPPEVGCCSGYDGKFSDPTLLEPVLARHPKLRIQLMHGANPPILAQTVAFVKAHPNVYVDMSPAMAVNPVRYEAALRAFLAAGIIDRVMLGTDGTDVMRVLANTESMSFLTDAQRRGIYYDNAARFFRITGQH
jgi:uncharacterized protein